MRTKQKLVNRILAILTVLFMAVTMNPVLTPAAETTVDQEWYNFRNNQENNSITDRPTPTNDIEAAQKWAVKYGSGWSAAPTPPLILDNYLYIGSGKKILKLNKETGEKVAESDDMAGNVGYAMNPLLYADGKLFAQLPNGVIQAVDYKTLKCVWKTEAVGGQTVSPISYTKVDGKGYIYTGTWSGENRDGTFFCATTDDSNVTDGVKKLEWKFIPSGSTKDEDPDVKYDPDLNATLSEEGNVAKRGFYWAGAYACEKYVAVGSDDGTSEGNATANGVFYTLNPTTGEIIDKISGIKGDIRTTVVYNEGYLYFCTKGGLLYKVAVDEDGKLSNASFMNLGNQITASPVVYKNKIYVGVRGNGGQFDPDGGHCFAVVDNSGDLNDNSVLYKIPIAGYPQASALLSTAYENVDYNGDGKPDGRVYIYFTYNANPGGIYYTYDEPGQTKAATTSKELFVPDKDKQQYCISTICADRNGTLYYKNDSCYLMAVETNEAYLKNATVKSEDGTEGVWNEAFDSKKSNYNIKLKTGSKKAEITLDLIEGSTATVNDQAYDGKAEVAIGEDGTAEAKVTVKKGKYSRTYTLSISCESDLAALASLKVNQSNSATSGILNLSPEFSSGTYDYTVDITNESGIGSNHFFNIWPEAASNGTLKVYPVENVADRCLEDDGTIEAISAPAINGYRYAVYPKDADKTIKVRVEVTSENGNKKQDYQITLLKKVDVTGVTLNESDATVDLTDTLQLKATIAPEDATYTTVKWYSLDGSVATVDQNGLVTPKKTGTTTIAVITDDKSMSATCKVTVVDKVQPVRDEAIKGLEAYKDLTAYRQAQKDEITKILDDAKTAISEAKTQEEIGKTVTDAKAKMDQIKTDAELTEDEAAGHHYGKWTVTKKATCTAAGQQTRECSVCGKTETADIKATGHKFKKVKTVAPTVKSTGYTLYQCSGCKKTEKRNTVAKLISIAKPQSVTKISTRTYTGKQIKPSVKIVVAKKTLKNGTDYTVKYGTNKIGSGTVTIVGKGKYGGTYTAHFTINPRKTSVSVKSTAKGKITASVAKRAEGTKYQISYATNAKFKGAKTVTTKSLKATLKGTSKKTYYVRVRVVKTIGSKNYVSGWSTVRKVNVK